MNERLDEELALLRSAFPSLEHRADGQWVRIPAYPLPLGIWRLMECEVAFQIPDSAGQQPYGFWVRPDLVLANDTAPQNYSYPTSTPFGDDWGKFSWAPEGQWLPKAELAEGSNMLNWARSFGRRLEEGA